MKKAFALAMAIAALLVPATAGAYGLTATHDVTLAKGQTWTGTYYAAGQTVTVDGDVNGDLICGGQIVTINGAVHGDVICGGQSVTINGPVDGSVRLGAQQVDINSTVGRNVTVAAQTMTLGSGAHVAGDLGALAQALTVSGPVDKTVYGRVYQLTLASAVGAVDVVTDNLTMGTGAKVDGNVHYVSDNTLSIDKSKVGGDITRSAPPVAQSHAARQQNATRAGFAWRLYWIFAALLLGLALVWLAPGLVRRAGKTMRERAGASIGWGVIVTLLAPILALLLMITVLGLPLGILVLALWAFLILMSSIFAGIAAGMWLLERADWEKGSLWWAALLGVPLTVVVLSVPVVGGVIGLVATWWAVGGISLTAKSLRS